MLSKKKLFFFKVYGNRLGLSLLILSKCKYNIVCEHK